MKIPKIEIQLPPWITAYVEQLPKEFHTREERMQVAIDLAAKNVEHGTGGPFGAAIFDLSSNTLVAPGVNLVETSNFSVLHAEIVAILVAQKMMKSYDLGGVGMPAFELVTSCEPCAMCLGAVPWSGVRSLVSGARGEDAVAIGFDEGEKPAAWVESLQKRKIEVYTDILRKEAAAVLRHYKQRGGSIYNGGKG